MTDTRNKDETQNQDATEHTEQPVAKVEDRQNIVFCLEIFCWLA